MSEIKRRPFLLIVLSTAAVGAASCTSAAQSLPLDQWVRHQIAEAPASGKRLFIHPVDLDGDGHLDIVAGADWFRNPGRIDGVWEARPIGRGFLNVAIATDVDGDGDPDLLGTNAELRGSEFALAINDGRGNFTVRSDMPPGNGDFLQGVAVVDLGDDLKRIVLSWHKDEVGLEVFSFPGRGANETWKLGVLSPFSQHEQVSPGDIDRDGDIDLWLGDHWLRNDGAGAWLPHKLGDLADANPNADPDRNRLVDVNGDGRLDAVVALENGRSVLWFEQPESDATQLWTRHVIGDSPGQGFSMDAADLDRDGDIDVLVGEHRNPDKTNRLLLFENLDGRGEKWTRHVIDADSADVIDHHDGTIIVDLDGDGDNDIISTGYYNSKVWIFENKALDPQ